MSLRRPTEARFLLSSFRGVASDTRSVHFLFLFSGLHIHVLYEQPACVHNGFCLFRDWHCDHRIFQSMIIIRCIMPVFIMFASTFKSTHWLVPCYCLGQISRMEITIAMTAPEPTQWCQQPREDRSYPGQLFLWEMESHRRRSTQSLPPSIISNQMLYS